MALVPPKSDSTYSDFVAKALRNIFGRENNIGDIAPPEWLSNYELPGEENIKNKISEKQTEIDSLEQELENLTGFKKLLYTYDDELENIVRDTFRQLGFTVEGEIPGGRDGILKTETADFVLEITGTGGGIKKKKVRQLDDHVESYIAENPEGEIKGLLIVNPDFTTDPDKRDIRIEPNVENYINRRGDYKVLTTPDLYQLIADHIKQEIDQSEVERLLSEGGIRINYP